MIFISIDDNEVDNSLKLCDEIFGEDNFVGVFVINSSPSAIDYGHIAKQHDYVVFYTKNLSEVNTNQLTEKDKEFKYVDKTGPFNIYPLYNGNVAFNPGNRPNLYYPFYLNPNNEIEKGFFEIGLEKQDGWVEVFPVVSKKDGIQRIWRWGKEKSKKNLNKEIIGYKTEDGDYRVVQKSRHTGKVIRSIQADQDISSRRGTAEVEELFGSKVFTFPKPIELVKKFLSISMEDDDIVLDFFAGSGTTAHAVLDLNNQDGLNLKFMLVQLPETVDNNKYPTITEITKERVRRVIKKLANEEAGQLPMGNKQDRGFRVFKLAESNFKGWDASAPKDGKALEQQLELHIEHIREGRTSEDILYEILLKSGFQLTTPVEKIELEGRAVYSVAGGGMLICLEKELSLEVIRAMAEKKPQRVICLDLGFAGNDQLKANAVQIFKTKEVVFKTV
jgi:adenine-specific DNA-methyltransferase